MFEKALRMKLRFTFTRGYLSVEDLWDLKAEELDTIFKRLNAKLKEQKEESLLETKTDADKVLELKVGIIKHIVKVKLEEKKEQEDKLLKAEKKQRLLEIIAKKQDKALEDMSIEDLTKMVEDL